MLKTRRSSLPSCVQDGLRLVVWIEPYVLPFVAIAPLFLPNPYRPVAAVVAIVFALLRWPVLGHVIRRTPLEWPIGLTIVGAIVGTLVSPVWDSSAEMLWGYMGAVALFYLIATRRSDANLCSYMLWLVGGPVLVAMLVWGVSWAKDASSLAMLLTIGGLGGIERLFPHENLIGGQWTYHQVSRLFPSVGSWRTNPNDLAWLYVFAFPFLLGGTMRGRWITRLVWLLLAVGLAGVLALTGSRAGLLSLGAGALGVLAARLRRPWLAIWLLIVPVALLAIGWLGLQSVPWLALPDASSLGRVDLWHTSFYMVQDFLFTGVGLGAWPIANQLLYGGDPTIANPHNMFLQTYLDLGPLGLIGLLWTVLWGLRVAFTPAEGESGVRAWIRLGLAGAWLALVVRGSFEATTTAVWSDGTTYHGIVAPTHWILAGLSAVLADRVHISQSPYPSSKEQSPAPASQTEQLVARPSSARG